MNYNTWMSRTQEVLTSNKSTTIQPLLQWFGGKWNAQYLLDLIPYSTKYIEPFGGAACILLQRRVSPIEVYNDLDEHLVNLFRVIRSPEMFDEFAHRVLWTPHSRKEFELACDLYFDENPVIRAWAFFIVVNHGLSGMVMPRKSRWSRHTSSTVSDKTSRLDSLFLWRDRLKRVQIENRDALKLIQEYDSEETTFYIDPPYPKSVRVSGEYNVELTDKQHLELIDLLGSVKGAVVLSSYNSELYDRLSSFGWEKLEFETFSYVHVNKTKKSRSPRIEVVWRNKQAKHLLKDVQQNLF